MIDQILQDPNAYIVFTIDHGPHLMNKQNNEDFSYISRSDMHSTILAMKPIKFVNINK